MIKYLARTCLMCDGYLGIVIAGRTDSDVHPIHGICNTCGYKIAWALISS